MSSDGVTRVYLLKPGETLGAYRVVRPLGAGGMGEVYLVEHIHLRKNYALKILPAAICAEPQFVDRFRIEARVMADLEHPGIVRVHNFGEDGGKYYLVMDYVEGADGAPRTLEDELAWGKKLPEPRVREIALQLCDALVYAHGFQGTGIIHRDLKPSNILLQSGGGAAGAPRIKVADFGLAKIVGGDYIKSVLDRTARLTILAPTTPVPVAEQATECGDATSPVSSTASLLGTYDYMSPEQKAGAAIDARSDLFAVGVILYRLLTGHKPDGAYEPPSKSGVDTAWDGIVKRCLQRNPDKRYATAAQMRADLATAGLPVFRKPRVRIAAAAAGALLLLGAVWFLRPAGAPAPTEPSGPEPAGVAAPAEAGPTITFTVRVQPADARVTVRKGDEVVAESDRPGARGNSFRLRPGVYTFTASKPGHRPQQQDIAVGPKETEWTVRLDEVHGLIRIASAEGSKVSILAPDGRPVEMEPSPAEGGRLDYRVLEGRYQVIITRSNHAAFSRTVEVTEERPVDVDAVLTGLPGRLRVRSTVPLEVWQFGTLLGTSGAWITGLPAGDQTIELRRDGFRSVRMPVTMPPGGEADIEAPALVTRHATVVVRAQFPCPGGVSNFTGRARVRIGDGGPETEVDLPHALETRDLGHSIRVSVSADGFRKAEPRSIRPTDDSTNDLVFDLVPKPSRIRLVSPIPAGIYRESAVQGTTIRRSLFGQIRPLAHTGEEMTLDPFVTHVLYAWAEGYLPERVEITLDKADTQFPDREVRLTPASPAFLEVVLDPETAELRVGGVVETNRILTLPSGMAIPVEIRSDGYRTQTNVLRGAAGATNQVRVALEKLPPAP